MIRESTLGLCVCCLTIILYLILWDKSVQRNIWPIYTNSKRCLNDKCKGANTEKQSAEKETRESFKERETYFDRKVVERKIMLKRNITTNEMDMHTNMASSDATNWGNYSTQAKSKKRKLIFILAQGRSGSSLLGDLFNRDDNAFYIFEPCLAVERFNKLFHFLVDNRTNLEFYKKDVISFLTGLLACKSNKVFEKYINVYDEVGSRSRTASFSKAPFRSVRITSDLVLKLCNNLTNYSVIKELEFRLPDKSIETIVNLSESLHLDLRLIHLVRDPRAYLISQMKLQWFFEKTNLTKRRFDLYIRERCKETLDYLKEVKNSRGKFKGKLEYLLLRFEDLIDQPDETLKLISNVTGTAIYTTSRDWFANMTKGKDLGERNRYQNGVRNAVAVKNAWKSNISKKILDTIQNDCAELMTELKYTRYDMKDIS